MNEQNHASGFRMMCALGAGALVGAGVAILFAPQSGRRTREMVASKTHDLKDATGEVIERGQHLVSEVWHKAQDAIEKGKEGARAAADDAKHQASDVAERGKQGAREAVRV